MAVISRPRARHILLCLCGIVIMCGSRQCSFVASLTYVLQREGSLATAFFYSCLHLRGLAYTDILVGKNNTTRAAHSLDSSGFKPCPVQF